MTQTRCPVCLFRRPIGPPGRVCRRCRKRLGELVRARPHTKERLAELGPSLDAEQHPEVRAHAGRQLRELLLDWRVDQRVETLYLREATDWSERDVPRQRYHAAYQRRAELFAMGYALDQIRDIRGFIGDLEVVPPDAQLHDIIRKAASSASVDADVAPGVRTVRIDQEDVVNPALEDDDALRHVLRVAESPYARIADLVSSRFHCRHRSSQLRLKRVNKSGGTGVRRQCLDCGEAIDTVSKANVPRAGESLPRFDEDLAQRRQDAMNAYRQRLYALASGLQQQRRDDADALWWREHNAYLQSPEWRRKRQAVLERDRYCCQARLDGCTDEAEQVHHLSYKHWKNEPLWELIAVCAHCHETLTAMDRERRAHRTGMVVASAP